MAILIALVLAIILQLGASVFAVSLIKRTKYNASWILISIGFTLMAVRRVYDLIYVLQSEGALEKQSIISNWLSVIVSLLIFLGAFYIRKIFDLQDRIDKIRKENESRVFAAIIKTEERERQTFAKELHDGLGPILSSVKMALSAINQSIAGDTNTQIIHKTNLAIDEAIITIKEISNKLSPHILTNFGLDKALRNFIDTVVINKNITVSFRSDIENKRFDFTVETVLYRVVCELLANTLHHAQAQNISIFIQNTPQELTLIYTDDGIGFTPENTKNSGMGLSNIQSRIASIHGVISIESSEGKGVQVFITVKHI
ncbi:MAG TPA: ATP-binding protein [Bacteroidales bacterium]|jgi:signal transduction histidine kinase|nr:ATP-binding protein [Bacteroidales bacterium]HRS19538.1 ATP-binding protein [Bacteroidales bacterium]